MSNSYKMGSKIARQIFQEAPSVSNFSDTSFSSEAILNDAINQTLNHHFMVKTNQNHYPDAFKLDMVTFSGISDVLKLEKFVHFCHLTISCFDNNSYAYFCSLQT